MIKKVVLISGGTSGIGKATTLQLLKDGFNVCAFAPQPPNVKAFAKELSQIFDSQNFLVISADVRKDESLKKVVAACLKKFKRIDILINNAGYGYFAEADAVNMQKFQDMMEVNVMGVARLTKSVLPQMKKQRKGQIVNIDSISGRLSGPRAEFYCASKFAIMGYSEGLRKELAKFGIKVSTVCPGMVKTNFLTDSEYKHRMKYLWHGKEPMRLEAQDIARSIAFVCEQPDHCNVDDVLIMPFG
jgi:3-hydroxy acid dehydrogenase/malonic semialdehyde reductase